MSQDVKETHKLAVKAARCRHNQRQESLVAVLQVILAICVALHLRHRLVDEHLIWIGVAKLNMALNLSDTAMKFVNHSDINDEVGRPGNVQTLYLQVSAQVYYK